MDEYKDLGFYKRPVSDSEEIINNTKEDSSSSNQFQRKLQVHEQPRKIRIQAEYQLGNISSEYEAIFRKGVEKYLQEVVYVFPLTKKYCNKRQQEVNNGYEGFCQGLEQNGKEHFTIPSNLKSTGADADLILFVTQNTPSSSQSYIAYAAACQWYNDRPIVGYINFNYEYYQKKHTIGNHANFEYHVETSLHEIFHSLGFSNGMIPFFRNSQGKRQSSNDIKKYFFESKIRGFTTKILATPEVLKETRKHYGCDSAVGAQLENQGTSGSIGSHCINLGKRTMFYNELMNPAGIQSDSITSKFTLAYLKDSNWYADVDLSFAESFQWGKNKGCDFLSSCSSSYPEFTELSIKQTCTFYHFGIGYGKTDDFSDNCPIATLYTNTDCTNPSHLPTHAPRTYESFSSQSKCFDSTFIQNGFSSSYTSQRCYKHQCVNNGNSIEITLQNGGTEYKITCNNNGEVLQPPNLSGLVGQLTCPQNISEFCSFPAPCENYCSSNGYCHRINGQNSCYCLNGYAGSDCSIKCDNFVNQSGQCVNQCDSKQYYHLGNKICSQCHSNCQQYCSGPTQNDCRKCPQLQFNDNGTCVQQCPQGKYADKNSGDCLNCSSNCSIGCIRESDNCLILSKEYQNNDAVKKDTNSNSKGEIGQSFYLFMVVLLYSIVSTLLY